MSVKERWSKTKPISYSTDDAIALLLPLLKSDERIVTAYLFGSRVSEGGSLSSDIDIAIFTSNNFLWEDYYALYGELTKRLHSDRLDMVWLNKAEPILSFEIVKSGRVLFFHDADMLNEFELKIKKKYYDYILYLNKHRRHREVGL